MEQNRLIVTGQLLEVRNPRVSPAGVPHIELVLEHRSRQLEAGQAREARLNLVVKLCGESWLPVVASLSPGQRVQVEGFLANASYRDAERPVLHAQTLAIKD